MTIVTESFVNKSIKAPINPNGLKSHPLKSTFDISSGIALF